MEFELAKSHSQVDHLKSQNEVLELTLEDAKTTNEKFSINLARHESNATALQLALAYADQVQSVKSRHQYFRFFGKKVVNIAILELGPVSNESLGNSTYYRGNLNFLNPSIF